MIPVALAVASEIAKSKVRRAKTNAVYLAVASGLGGIAVIFALIAATAALSNAVGFIGGCLIMAGIFSVLTVIVLLLHSNVKMRKHRYEKVPNLTEAALTSLPPPSSVSPTTLAVLAIAAGFLFSKKK